MTCLPLFLNLCISSSAPTIPTHTFKIQSGLASRYGYPGDKYENFKQPYACYSSLTKKWGLSRYQEMVKMGVAHRDFPCGKQIIICKIKNNKKSCTNAVVVDRGPYGALDRNGRWHRRSRLFKGERWRGIIDVLPPIASKLGIKGLEKVIIKY